MKFKNYPQIVVFNEKHGDRYFLIESKEAELKMYLDVLKNRNMSGYYTWMMDHKPYGKAPAYTKEDIRLMPASMEEEKKKLLNDLLKYEKEEKESSQIRKDWNKIQESIDKNDGELARELIHEFRSGQYEGFESVSFEHLK